MITIEQMVQREVLCCMSSMVGTLAKGYGAVNRGFGYEPFESLADLCEQASELAAPVLDYEEAALQEGWIRSPYESACFIKRQAGADDEGPAKTDANLPDAWERLCNELEIDPYEWEVFEHWAVSAWLAEKLIAQGEKVDNDFAGMAVWARTTTGQAISMDGCVQRIYKEMVGQCESLSPEATSQ